MLHMLSDLKRTSIGAIDGDIGHVKDAYFDDREWTLRYLVVDTGGWLPGRKVLITPLSIVGTHWADERLNVNLTREQVENSPGIDTDKPVSRQHEMTYFDYYGYPYYWTGPFMWGPVAYPTRAGIPGRTETLTPEARAVRERERENADPHLRSADEVSGYHIEASDGAIGHVENFLFADENWSLRYFVVDTRNWLPGRKVLISTDWVERVSWRDRKAYVALTRDEVRNSPEYDYGHISETEEDALYQHYGRQYERTSDRPPARVQPH